MFFVFAVVFQDSSSDEDEDDVGPAVVGKEKRVASERCARSLSFFVLGRPGRG